MSAGLWLACCAGDARADLARAVLSVEPGAQIRFVDDPRAMRLSFLEEEPRVVAAAVGLSASGVSDINLAAALVADGRARKVVLVGRSLSGSLRSRAQTAGVAAVIDLDTIPARMGGAGPGGTGAAADAQPASEAYALSDITPMFDAHAASDARTAPGAIRKVGDGRRQPAPSVRAGERRRRVDAQKEAPVLVVSSGRGGVGKTAIVATAATVAASWGMRVSVVDLDLSCGNLFSCFGLPRGAALDGAVGSGGPMPEGEEWMSHGVAAGGGVTLFGPCSRPELAERVAPAVTALLDAAAAESDLVLVDTSATCTDATAQAFQRCSRLLLVHEEAATFIGSLARVSALAVRLGVARTRIVRVANHGDRHRSFDLYTGRSEAGLETARAYRVLEGGFEVGELLAEGNVAELARIESDFTVSVGRVLAQVLEELGRLPAADGARKALEQSQPRKRRFALGRKKAS